MSAGQIRLMDIQHLRQQEIADDGQDMAFLEVAPSVCRPKATGLRSSSFGLVIGNRSDVATLGPALCDRCGILVAREPWPSSLAGWAPTLVSSLAESR